MKTKVLRCFVLLLTVLLLIIPAAVSVSANSPYIPEDNIQLYVTNYEGITQIRMVLLDENGEDIHADGKNLMGYPYIMGAEEIEKAKDNGYRKGLAFTYLLHDNHDFCFEFTYRYGTVYTTEVVEASSSSFGSRMAYKFDGKTREFETTRYTRNNAFSSFFDSIGYGLFLLIPLAVTILIEWLISLPFRIRRPGVIILTNLVSNFVMNLALAFILAFGDVDYVLLVVIAELIVAGLEYLFYCLKIKNYKKWLLLIYTVVANLASWGIYTFVVSIMA